MPNQRATEYYANLEGRELAAELLKRFSDHIDRMKNSRRHSRMARSWSKYFAEEQGRDGTQIMSGGRQGETTIIKPGRYRARLQRLLNMNAGAVPSWDAIALNTDSSSTRESQLADHIIEYYGTVQKLWERLLERDEYAHVFGEAFIADLWDPNRGDLFSYKPVPKLDDSGQPVLDEQGQPETEDRPVYKGDFRTLVLSPYDCALEPYSEDRDKPSWSIIRYLVNRWDLAALYPLQREAILACGSWSNVRRDADFLPIVADDEDAIPVYEWHHVHSPSLPKGKQCRFIETEILGASGPLEYKMLPVFRTTAGGDVSLIDGDTGGGWTPGFDLLPVVDARQAQLSMILSNHSAFGVQSLKATKGAGIDYTQIGPMTIIEVPQGAELEPINFTHTPQECFTFLDVLEAEEDFVTLMNAAARGESSTAESGSKAAFSFSMAQQTQNRFQRSRQMADSLLLTHKIDTLKTHASVERVIEIGGKSNAYAAENFVGDDISHVSRVIVHPGDPMRDTASGRYEIAQMLLQQGGIKTPEQIYQVLSTGRLEHVYEDETLELDLIKQENELLADDASTEPVPVIPTDRHGKHLTGHRAILSNPRLRTNAVLLKRVMEHVMQHVQALQTLDPNVLMALGEQPIASPDQPQAPPPNDKPDDTSAAAHGKAPAPKPDAGSAPQPPRGPVNPSTGERAEVSPPPLQQMTPTA